jgi:hypothetical protein
MVAVDAEAPTGLSKRAARAGGFVVAAAAFAVDAAESTTAVNLGLGSRLQQKMDPRRWNLWGDGHQ